MSQPRQTVSPPRTCWPQRAALVGFLAVHAGLLLNGLRQNFVTVDEVAYLPAGLSHWQTGTFTLYRVNPPLPRALAVLPVLARGPAVDYRHYDSRPGARSEGPVGVDFATRHAADYFRLVCLARLAGVAWSLAGALLVFHWSKALYGERAAWVGLALWCFSPNVLAHAQLLTPDVPAAVAGLAATYAFWRYLRSPSWEWAFFAGLLLGVAELTKFTLLVLYAVWPALWLAFFLRRRGPRPRWAQLLFLLALSVLVINVGYAFTGTGRPLGEAPFVSRALSGEARGALYGGDSGNRFRGSWAGPLPVPLPEDFVRGVDEQWRDFEAGWPSYLAGEWRRKGWWYYYLYAFTVKVPLGALALVLWGLALLAARHPSCADWTDELTLALPALAVLALVSWQTGFTHHLRYTLPMFPFVIVSTSKVGYFLAPGRRTAGMVVIALLCWAAVSSLRVYPHSLSYFNEAAGGPENGPNHLLDSNIDWGQDLLFLADWLKEHPEARPLKLAYFGRAGPSLLGIRYELPAYGPHGGRGGDVGPLPGFYAVSVNFVWGMSFPAPDGQGSWEYVPLHGYEYFKLFQPIAKAGYSIYIYHITPDQANAVRRQMGLPPLPSPAPTRPTGPGP